MENLPSIFLSHSGKQKPEFVTHLYYALLRVHHRPFFDMDTDHSLPIGLDYPSRIFQACEACKIGVIVVTDDYIKNMWPMLELQHLLLPSASPDRRIFPLFYELRPGDLSDAVKLEHWKKCWAEKAPMWEAQMSELTADMPHSGCKFQINLNIGSWPDNLRTLQHRSGEVRGVFYGENERHIFTSDYDYIQKIVSSICIALPPPQTYLLDNAIKGQERIHEEMVKEFEQEAGSTGVDEVRVIGVYGIGGSGKSTVCNIMAKVYSNQFPGRCLHLEFPTDGKTQELLNAVKSVLHTLGEPNVENVSNMKRAMNLLQNGLQIDKVFLALDNIWSNHVEDAKMILSTKWKPGSRILITGRSKRVLERVLDGRVEVEGPSKIVHVPSLSEEEAMEALRSYSCFSCYIPEDSLRSLARSCFFGNHCHALYLRLKGVELREKGRPSFNVQQWKDLMSSLQMDGHHVHAHEGQPREQEAGVIAVIEQSVDRLPLHLQDIFINLVTFQNFDLGLEYCYPDPIWAMLRLFCDKWCGTENELYYNVLALEYHGLVEIHTEYYRRGRGEEKHLLVHDLLRHVVQSRVSRPEYATSAFLRTMKEGGSALVGFSNQNIFRALVGSTSWRERIWRALFGSTTFTTHQMRVLRLHENGVYGGRFRSLQLGRANLQALRVLTLEYNGGIKEIRGWEGVPNLMWLNLTCLLDLKRIAPIGCLKRLERLFFRQCEQLELKSIIGRHHGDRIMRTCLVKAGDQLPKLHTLKFLPCELKLELGPLPDAFPALKTLVLGARLLECFNPDVGSGNNSWGPCRDELSSAQQANITSHLGTHSSLHELDIFSICPQNLWASQVRQSCGKVLCISSLLRDDAAGVAIDAGGTTVLSLLAGNIIHRHKIKHECTTPAAAAARESNLLGPTICNCPVHLFPFLHLRNLSIVIQDPACTRHIRWLDVSGLPRLRFLHLGSFESVEQLFFQSTSLAYAEYYVAARKCFPASMKKIHIQDFPSLLEISGLGAHYTKLSTLKIERCTSLVRISSMQVSIMGMDAFPYVDCNNLFSRAVESSVPLLGGNIYGAEGSSGTLL